MCPMTYMYVCMYACTCFERRRARDHQRGGDAPPQEPFGFENQLELGSDLSQLFRHFFKNPTGLVTAAPPTFGGSREGGREGIYIRGSKIRAALTAVYCFRWCSHVFACCSRCLSLPSLRSRPLRLQPTNWLRMLPPNKTTMLQVSRRITLKTNRNMTFRV